MPSEFTENARALTVGADAHNRLVVLPVKRGGRIIDALTGNDKLLFHQNLTAIAIIHQLGAKWYVAVLRGLQRATVFADVGFHQTQLQRAGTTDHVLQTRGVRRARHLNHDAVSALLLNDRLGETQRIDPVAEHLLVLLNCRVSELPLCIFFERDDQTQILRRAVFLNQQIRISKRDLFRCFFTFHRVAKFHRDGVARFIDAAVLHFLLAQQHANI